MEVSKYGNEIKHEKDNMYFQFAKFSKRKIVKNLISIKKLNHHEFEE